MGIRLGKVANKKLRVRRTNLKATEDNSRHQVQTQSQNLRKSFISWVYERTDIHRNDTVSAAAGKS